MRGSVGLLALAACKAEAPAAEPAEQAPGADVSRADPRQQFAGNWKLVRVERYDANGELLPPPELPAFGAGEPLGFIMYDPAGYMGVVIQQDGRQPYAGERPRRRWRR